jgi:hypothetical protein
MNAVDGAIKCALIMIVTCIASAALAQRTYPITGEQDSGDMGGFHMYTTATISNNGRVDLVTNINNHTWLNGHCGSVFIYILDENGNILSGPRTGGQWCVDGKGIPFTSSDRTIPWEFTIAGDEFNKAAGWTIFYSVGEKPTAVFDFIDTVRDKLKSCPECLAFLSH